MSIVIESSNLNTREELIGAIFDRLHGLSNAVDDQSREIEKLTGLSKNQALVINILSRSPSANVSELARSMYLNPATMVRILDRFEEQELITRTRSKEDRRVVEIRLTEKARKTKQTLFDIMRDSLMRRFETTEKDELLNVLTTLQKISNMLETAACIHPGPEEPGI